MADVFNRAGGDGAVGREALQRFTRELAQTASSLFSALLSRHVAFKPLRPQGVGPGTFPVPAVIWRMLFTKGLSGWAAVLFKAPDAVALAQLLLGEESRSGTLSAEGLRVLREAANQVAGALATSLGNLRGGPVGCELPQVVTVKEEGELHSLLEGLPTVGEAMLTELTVEGVFTSEVLLILQPSLLRELQAVLASNADDTPFPPISAESTPRRSQGIDLLFDVPLVVAVELGRARMPIREILHLAPGSVIELDKLAGEPVDILVNDTPIAKGEVVIIGENFGVRLTQIVNQVERIQSLR